MPYETVPTCETDLIHNGFTKVPPILSLLFVIKIIEALRDFLTGGGEKENKDFLNFH